VPRFSQRHGRRSTPPTYRLEQPATLYLSPPAHPPTVPPAFRRQRHRQRHPGAGRPWQPKRRPITRSIFDCDTTSARRVHHRDLRRGHLYPHFLPLDVSVHLGTLAQWEGAPHPKELAVAALPRVDPPSMTPRRLTGRGPVRHPRSARARRRRCVCRLVEDCPKRRPDSRCRAVRTVADPSAGSSINRSPEVPPWLSSPLPSPPSLFGVAGLARSRSSTSRRCSHDLLLVQSTICRASILPSNLRIVGASAAIVSRRPTYFVNRGAVGNPFRISFAVCIAAMPNVKLGFGASHVFRRHPWRPSSRPPTGNLSLNRSIRGREKPRAR